MKPESATMAMAVRAGFLLALLNTAASLRAEGERYAVYKSTDRGRSWSRAGIGLPPDARINAFCASAGSIFIGTDAGVFASRDSAATWEHSSKAAGPVGRITSVGTLGETVFAGSASAGLLASANQGGSWAAVTAFPAKSIRCMTTYGDRLFVGTDKDGVFSAIENGRDWQAMKGGLPEHAQIFSLCVGKGRIFAGLYSKGLMAWSDSGHRWARVGPVSPLALASSGGMLIAGHNPGGIHWSADLGSTWSRAMPHASVELPEGLTDSSGQLPLEAPVWELTAGDGLAVAGAASGVFYSEDHGRTWLRASVGLPEEGPGIAFLAGQDLVLAAIAIKAPGNAPPGVPSLSPKRPAR